jgi:hypothetical protein
MPIQSFNLCEAHNQIEWMSAGDSHQRCSYTYLGVQITEHTYFPHNWFKKTKVWYIVDYMLSPEFDKIIAQFGGRAVDSDTYYCEEGNWFAEFTDVNKMVDFVDGVVFKLTQKDLAVRNECFTFMV